MYPSRSFSGHVRPSLASVVGTEEGVMGLLGERVAGARVDDMMRLVLRAGRKKMSYSEAGMAEAHPVTQLIMLEREEGELGCLGMLTRKRIGFPISARRSSPKGLSLSLLSALTVHCACAVAVRRSAR